MGKPGRPKNDPAIALELGRLIKYYRTKIKEWQMEQTARKIPCSKYALYSWEKGLYVPTYDNVLRLSSVLGIPLTEIEEILRKRK